MSAIETIFTIGHSTHEAAAFLDLLERHRIEVVADVRRFPSSRRMPWFNAGELRETLGEAGIEYVHLPELGGRRDPLPDSPNGGWRVGQFRGYADHMAREEFEAGLARLLSLEGRVAVMCAEAQWVRCHRRLLSDTLVARGYDVRHISSRGSLESHALTDFAVIEAKRVRYPPTQASLGV